MHKRCPWCGEMIKVRQSRYFSIKCPHCDNEYLVSRSVNTSSVLNFLGIILFILYSRDIIYGISCLFICFAISIRFEDAANLVKVTYKYIYETKYKTRIVFSYTEKNLHTFLRSNKILPICFVNEHSIPISQVGCVSLDDIKLENNICECTISILVNGKIDNKFPMGTEFYVFYQKEKIGKGILIGEFGF